MSFEDWKKKTARVVNSAAKTASDSSRLAQELWAEHEGTVIRKGHEAINVSREYFEGVLDGFKSSTDNLIDVFTVSKRDVDDLEERIKFQGGYYRELNRRSSVADSILIGGELLGSIQQNGFASSEVEAAYAAAYPDLAQNHSFVDKVRELDENSMPGFIAGVKGKLFEQKYVDYLNQGNLPDGYVAVLAESPIQAGWDIAIHGTDGEITSLLQAKATDSVSYVKEALEKYPSIDVVTTDEVYSHLVMSGISDGIASGLMSNETLMDTIESAVDSSNISMDFSPPILALAFIAFTSYKDESLTLYAKAQNAGSRSGKAYLSYLIGGGLAVISNTWWLGVVGSVSSRILSDRGRTLSDLHKKFQQIDKSNKSVIRKLEQIQQ